MSDDIRPRVDEDGVECCDEGCPQYKRNAIVVCKAIPRETRAGIVCFVAARRNAALLRECRGVLGLAAGVPDNTIQIMRQEGLKIEDIKDPMQKLAFTIHSEACEVAGQAENLLERIGE